MSPPKAIRNAAPVVPLTAGEFTPQNQICVSPEAEPSPPDSGWSPRRGPQPLSSGEAIRRATHLRAKLAASPDDSGCSDYAADWPSHHCSGDNAGRGRQLPLSTGRHPHPPITRPFLSWCGVGLSFGHFKG